ncbi:hypothetical protein PIIN_09328 [Serendipita indica DSM 11827]|uniref:Uncharacterized protein n=1 Tax=Serendipita indica (strain DSM 11827) TaxID=1109443 RepID=G4TVK1_SERID|nr:hypothetical protein PIIN_09328 [Serendipita indica DSM 11827]
MSKLRYMRAEYLSTDYGEYACTSMSALSLTTARASERACLRARAQADIWVWTSTGHLVSPHATYFSSEHALTILYLSMGSEARLSPRGHKRPLSYSFPALIPSLPFTLLGLVSSYFAMIFFYTFPLLATGVLHATYGSASPHTMDSETFELANCTPPNVSQYLDSKLSF